MFNHAAYGNSEESDAQHASKGSSLSLLNSQNSKGHDHGFVGRGRKAMIMAAFLWLFDFSH